MHFFAKKNIPKKEGKISPNCAKLAEYFLHFLCTQKKRHKFLKWRVNFAGFLYTKKIFWQSFAVPKPPPRDKFPSGNKKKLQKEVGASLFA